ncbi:hypothetical protein [Timonella sp. A28]|uniref:hypothetical protein n=1 Tax=Timonella sp. A28 TaxID=3442640 RepID=UPI003EB95E64
MNTENLYSFFIFVTTPVVVVFNLYFAIPTISKKFPTTDPSVGWVALFIGVVQVIYPFPRIGWYAIFTIPITVVVFVHVWRKTKAALSAGKKITVQFFFSKPPHYGENIV